MEKTQGGGMYVVCGALPVTSCRVRYSIWVCAGLQVKKRWFV